MQYSIKTLRLAFEIGITVFLVSAIMIIFNQHKSIINYESKIQALEEQDLMASGIDLYRNSYVTGSQIISAERKYAGYYKIVVNNTTVMSMDSVYEIVPDASSVYKSSVNDSTNTIIFTEDKNYSNIANLKTEKSTESVNNIKDDVVQSCLRAIRDSYTSEIEQAIINEKYNNLYENVCRLDEGAAWGLQDATNALSIFDSIDPDTGEISMNYDTNTYHAITVLAFSALMKDIDETIESR